MKNKSGILHSQNLSKIIVTFLVLFFLTCMVISPARYISASLDGISAWAFNVLPSVLPFMFFTRLLSSLDTMPKLTQPFSFLTRKLFNTPPISIYAFLMAILSGYPVGSKIVSDLYLQGKITQNDAFKMLSFCSTSGPMFIVGAVGVKMFHSAKIGYLLFASHLLGAMINGLVFRSLSSKKQDTHSNFTLTRQSFDINEIVLNSTLSILSVGCIIVIFFIIITTFMPFFNLLPAPLSALLQGVVEITKGSLSLSTLPNKFFAISAASFVISFGGISTLLQSISMTSSLKMSTALFALQKMMHGLFSCITTILLLLI